VQPGRYTLTAVAIDDSGMMATSAPVNIAVENAAVRIVSPSHQSRFAAPANISITTATPTPGNLNRVEFFSNQMLLGQQTVAPFDYTWSSVSAGNYLLRAVAVTTGGIRETSAPVSVVVINNTGPSVALISPANGAVFEALATIPLEATASDSQGSVTSVEFYRGAQKIGEDATPPYIYTDVNVGSGSYAYRAVATDDLGARTDSATVTVTVSPNVIPIVQSVTPTPGTVGGLSNLVVTFSEPMANVDASDLRINGAAAQGVKGNGVQYTFDFTQPPAGAVTVTWAANHGIRDLGNPSLAFAGTNTWQFQLVDLTPPVISFQFPAPDAILTNLTQIEVGFSETVNGVGPADLLVNGTPALNVSRNGLVYTFFFPQPVLGPVQISWAATHGIVDTAANGFNATAPGATWSYMLEAPRAILVATNATYRLFKGLAPGDSGVSMTPPGPKIRLLFSMIWAGLTMAIRCSRICTPDSPPCISAMHFR
jgi:hypothetical protein